MDFLLELIISMLVSHWVCTISPCQPYLHKLTEKPDMARLDHPNVVKFFESSRPELGAPQEIAGLINGLLTTMIP